MGFTVFYPSYALRAAETLGAGLQTPPRLRPKPARRFYLRVWLILIAGSVITPMPATIKSPFAKWSQRQRLIPDGHCCTAKPVTWMVVPSYMGRGVSIHKYMGFGCIRQKSGTQCVGTVPKDRIVVMHLHDRCIGGVPPLFSI